MTFKKKSQPSLPLFLFSHPYQTCEPPIFLLYPEHPVWSLKLTFLRLNTYSVGEKVPWSFAVAPEHHFMPPTPCWAPGPLSLLFPLSHKNQKLLDHSIWVSWGLWIPLSPCSLLSIKPLLVSWTLVVTPGLVSPPCSPSYRLTKKCWPPLLASWTLVVAPELLSPLVPILTQTNQKVLAPSL